MTDSTGPAAATAEAGSFRIYRHIVIGFVIALISPFTALAWPFAILLGIVIGRDDVERRQGIKRSAASTIVGVLAVAGGVLATIFFGAIVGGLIALPIVVLAAFSERAAADGQPVDRVMARLMLFVMPILTYIVLIAIGANINIRVGA